MQIAVERRPTLLFLIVLAGLFLIMSASTRTRVFGETRTMLERIVMSTFSPVPRAVNFTGQQLSDGYHGYIDMRRSVGENLELHRKVAQLTEERLRLLKSEDEIARLRSLLFYSEQFPLQSRLAQVVMVDTDGRFRSIILDRGSDAGIEINDAVVSPAGLVGRVVLTTRDLSKVQLVGDSNATVGSIIDRTRRQAVLSGDGRGGLELRFVPSLSDVQVGDSIITGGIDGIFPKGIPVAKVIKVGEGKDLFKAIYCRPTVDFSKLEEVIILKTRKLPPEVVRYNP